MAQSLQPGVERKYTVLFDCMKVAECFSNTLHVMDHVASLPPLELQVVAAHVKEQGLHASEYATRVVEENEAALQDFVEDEHLPSHGPEDDESDK